MGTIIESFANLSEYLADQYKKSKKRSSQIELFQNKALQPFMPSGIRLGTGMVADIKDREVGPFDIVGTLDSFPPFGEGQAATYMADGVQFVIQVRDWAESDLTQFGELSAQVKKIERKRKVPIVCLAVSFGPLSSAEVSQFMASKPGQSIDAILSVGHHIVLRNSRGLYGDPGRVPFVTEHPGPEALKAFTFFLLQLTQSALNIPFGLADYQHL